MAYTRNLKVSRINLEKRSHIIKSIANELGFEEVGISRADFLEEDAPILEAWLNQDRHGQMNYMANHFDKRLDPRKLVPGAKSVISLSYNYYTTEKQRDPEAPKISSYAYGRDYHKVIKKKLQTFLARTQEQFGEVHGRCFVDSAPIMERSWAKKSGLGWIGKNSLLLTKGKGSFFFLAELIIDLELTPDSPVKDYCGTCTKCIDACPTDAIYEPYKVDGSKCISYFTIELKEAIPKDLKGNFENWAFGCDICQDVCPINARSKPHKESDFEPKEELLEMTKQDWKEMTEEVFDRVFTGTPVKRTKFKGLQRNIKFLLDEN